MTHRSLNEIEQTVRKAARGCGLPWGVADEVGKAIRWLHGFGLNGIYGLNAVLDRYDHQNSRGYAPMSLTGVWQAPAGTLSPLLTGPSLCDCMEMLAQQPIVTGKIAHPVLTAGFLGQKALIADQPIRLEWSSVTLEFHRAQLAISGNRADLNINICDALRCTRMPRSKYVGPTPGKVLDAASGGVAIDDALWEKLEGRAHLTYVAATEASRLAGAGAGLSDND